MCHSCPKRGHTEAEYEDAMASNKTQLRFAVADGASESSFAALWARLLAQAFVRGQITPITLLSDLEPLQVRWRKRVQSKKLPWYASQKVEGGAFAALVGLTLIAGNKRQWQAIAVGDCCLFHVRGHSILRTFPAESTDDFNNRPILISSNPARNVGLNLHVRAVEGQWQKGDTFLLMSDALAAFFLGQVAELGRLASDVLSFDNSDDGFQAWVSRSRASGLLMNDDVSLLRVDVH